MNENWTEKICHRFINNPFMHPVSEETLEIGSDLHTTYMKKCAEILTDKDVAREIMVHITSDNSIIASKLCLDVVNNTTNVHQVYDPITRTTHEVTSAYSKTLLENCTRVHNVVMLHIQIEDVTIGNQVFIPVKLKQYFGKGYIIENFKDVIRMVEELIDSWASKYSGIDEATLNALRFALNNITFAMSNNNYVVIKMTPNEKMALGNLQKRLEYIRATLRTAKYEHDAIKGSIQSKLKSKAEQARRKTSYKNAKDSECYARQVVLLEKYNTLVLDKYLSGYLKKKTIDLTLHEFYKGKLGDMYDEVVFNYVKSTDYIFLQDEQKQVPINKDWLQKQHEYILTLSTEQLFNIWGYTHNGDVFVNNYVRGTFNPRKFLEYIEDFCTSHESYFPLFFPALKFITSRASNSQIHTYFKEFKPHLQQQVNKLCDSDVTTSDKYVTLVDVMKYLTLNSWKAIIDMYSASLQNIIMSAPRTMEPMYLYRGVKDDHYLQTFMNKRYSRVFEPKSFVSTSSSITIGRRFTESLNACCFMRILVPVGTPVLLMLGMSQYKEESEFLLNKATKFIIKKSSTEVFCTPFTAIYKEKMRVSDLEII